MFSDLFLGNILWWEKKNWGLRILIRLVTGSGSWWPKKAGSATLLNNVFNSSRNHNNFQLSYGVQKTRVNATTTHFLPPNFDKFKLRKSQKGGGRRPHLDYVSWFHQCVCIFVYSKLCVYQGCIWFPRIWTEPVVKLPLSMYLNVLLGKRYRLIYWKKELLETLAFFEEKCRNLLF